MAERSLRGGRVVLEGAIDMHVHFGPEPLIEPLSCAKHGLDPFEAAREALELGMRAIVLKPHEFASTTVAYMANDAVGSDVVFAGICCDYPSGGLNPVAVETALRSGARVVWLPTISSRQTPAEQIRLLFGRSDGIAVIDDEGELVDDVREIVRLVEEYDAVLATGHTTKAEHVAIARAIGTRGRLLVTHAMQQGFGPQLSLAECAALAELGATIELTAHSCMGPPASVRKVFDAVQAIGAERIVLSSDYGWSTDVPRPAPGFRSYLDALWEEGAKEEDLKLMTATNPARLLRLG